MFGMMSGCAPRSGSRSSIGFTGCGAMGVVAVFAVGISAVFVVATGSWFAVGIVGADGCDVDCVKTEEFAGAIASGAVGAGGGSA